MVGCTYSLEKCITVLELIVVRGVCKLYMWEPEEEGSLRVEELLKLYCTPPDPDIFRVSPVVDGVA